MIDDAEATHKAEILQRTMEALALRLTGDRQAVMSHPWEFDVMHACETDRCLVDVERSFWYLGGGYWRATVRRDATNHVLMQVRLVNPDYTHAQICQIEEAMRLLRVLPKDDLHPIRWPGSAYNKYSS